MFNIFKILSKKEAKSSSEESLQSEVILSATDKYCELRSEVLHVKQCLGRLFHDLSEQEVGNFAVIYISKNLIDEFYKEGVFGASTEAYELGWFFYFKVNIVDTDEYDYRIKIESDHKFVFTSYYS